MAQHRTLTVCAAGASVHHFDRAGAGTEPVVLDQAPRRRHRQADRDTGRTRAYVDGPYGAFSIDRNPDARGFVMAAGGVGITPMLANLHAMRARRDPRPVVLFYANPDWESFGFREDLASGESGYLDGDILKRNLPAESRDWTHLLCGPAPMTDAVRDALRERGVPADRVASEVFEFA